MNKVDRILYSGIAFSIFGLGISLQIKAAIGFSALDTFIISLSIFSGIKVGTITIIFSLVMSLILIVLSRLEYFKQGFVEFLMSIFMGVTINILVPILHRLPINIHEVVVMILGIQISAVSVAAMIEFNLFVSPFESLINYISDCSKINFLYLRWVMDFLMIIITLCISNYCKLIVPIGTGTVISICIYSISVHLYRKMLRRVVICHRDYEI
jgi:membrane spanning protein